MINHKWKIALLSFAVAACSNDSTNVSDVPSLQITDTQVGTGAEAIAGKNVTVKYTGWLYDAQASNHHGSQFDSGTFPFALGTGRVIKGWDQGIVGMRVGGKRTLIIPSSLAYGPTGSGPIPPNAALVFDVELLSVQ